MVKASIVHISNRILYEGPADLISLPGVLGTFEVMEFHGPIVSLLAEGSVTVQIGNHAKEWPIRQGLVRFDDSRLYAVVE